MWCQNYSELTFFILTYQVSTFCFSYFSFCIEIPICCIILINSLNSSLHFVQHFTKCLQIFSKLYINPSSGTLSVNYLFFSLWIIWVWAKIKSLKWDICSSSVLGLIFCFNNWSFYLNIFSPVCRFCVLHGLCCSSLNSDFMLFTLGLFLALSPRIQVDKHRQRACWWSCVEGGSTRVTHRWAAHVWSIDGQHMCGP